MKSLVIFPPLLLHMCTYTERKLKGHFQIKAMCDTNLIILTTRAKCVRYVVVCLGNKDLVPLLSNAPAPGVSHHSNDPGPGPGTT